MTVPCSTTLGSRTNCCRSKDNSLWIHPGYTKSTLAQQSLSDLRPVQDTKYFGNVIKFTIPPMADLLGPVDLMLDLNEAVTKKSGDDDDKYDDTYVGWVETLGYAMIDYATLSIGQNEIERISGDQMQIMNELMTGKQGQAGADGGDYGPVARRAAGRPAAGPGERTSPRRITSGGTTL